MRLPERHAKTTLEIVRTVANVIALIITILIAHHVGVF